MHAAPAGAVAPRAAAADATAPHARTFASLPAFIRGLAFTDLPGDVVHQAGRCLLDLVGVAAAGTGAESARIARSYVTDQMAGGRRSARILFDGRRAGLAGAAFAGATAIDAVDAHDGHPLTKGHAGVTVLPALLAFLDGDPQARAACDGREFLTCIVLGYEIATRAGIALHASTPDYHCSGAWNALAAAALGGRLLRLDDSRLRHALGIAEYHGPRGQILRVCAAPTMLKDGSSMGALAGVAAALLAADGFTGAPAVTVEDDATAHLWRDLGVRWRIREQYFKPHPVCRWAQPAIEATLALARAHRIAADDVEHVRIDSFAEAVALGNRCAAPATSDEAQYSIAWPVAAALVFGGVGADELDHVHDPRVARLLRLIELTEAPELSARFPAQRLARVRIALRDGRVLASADTPARGDAEAPLDDAELDAKYARWAAPVLGSVRAARIAGAVRALPAGGPDAAGGRGAVAGRAAAGAPAVPLDALLDDLLAPPA